METLKTVSQLVGLDSDICELSCDTVQPFVSSGARKPLMTLPSKWSNGELRTWLSRQSGLDSLVPRLTAGVSGKNIMKQTPGHLSGNNGLCKGNPERADLLYNKLRDETDRINRVISRQRAERIKAQKGANMIA